MINQQMTKLEWALLLGLSVLWGGSFFFVEVALNELPPLSLVWIRVSLAAGYFRRARFHLECNHAAFHSSGRRPVFVG